MPEVKVDDIQIYYEVHGKGFPLIMIMGVAGNVDWWDPRLMHALSKKFKLTVFDNRGAGRTDISEREYTIKMFADDTAGMMDALGITKAHVSGISMGGMIAQELVLNHPKKVEKLIICSTHCGGAKSFPASRGVLEMLAADRSTVSQEEITRMTVPLLFTEDFIQKNSDFIELSIKRVLKAPISNVAFTRQLNAITEFDTYERLSQIKVPTLILHGKHDILIPPENGAILTKAIPHAKLVYFSNAAHALIEEMDRLIEVSLNFLTES